MLGVFPVLRTTALTRPSWLGARVSDDSMASMLTFFFSFISRSKLHVVTALSSPEMAERVNRGPV